MSDNIRSFAAIALPDELKSRIGDYMGQLSQPLPSLKWVRINSLHITLKFLGEQPAEKIDQVFAQLTDIPKKTDKFSLTIAKTGAFPSSRKPRAIWLGIKDESEGQLYNLFNSIQNSLEPLGFEKEKRKFSPHLTLARVKIPQDFSDFWSYVEDNPFEPYSFEVDHFVLMRSFLKRSGAEYQVLHSYQF